jgi:competence protein ComEC
MSFFYVFYHINNVTSVYNNEKYIYGYVNEIKDNYIVIKGKENVLVYTEDKNISINNYLKIEGNFVDIKENSNFNLFNYKKYLLSKNIKKAYKSSKITIIKNKKDIKYYFYYYVKNYNSKYLDMFLLQEYNYDVSSYQENGIIHLFSISGMHITLISMYIIKALQNITKRSITIYLLVITILTTYAYIINFPISVLRSIIMFMLDFLNKTFNLMINKINLFIITIAIALIINPFTIYRSSFYFSYIISFFIIYIKPKNLLQTSFLSYIVSIPILIYNYYSINLTTIIINLLFIPIITIIYPLSIFTLILPNSIIVDFLMSRIDILSEFITNFSINLTMAKPNIIVILIYYVLIFLSFRNKKILLILITLLILHHNIRRFNPSTELHMIDVNQGDSFLFTSKDLNILIDTGDVNSDYTLIPYLKSIGIVKIDYLILTHGHSDHIKEAINIIDNFKIGCIFFNKYDNEEETIIINYIKEKDICYKNIEEKRINHKNIFVELTAFDNKDENENGIITHISFNNRNILLMADVYQEQENKLKYKDIDVLKIGHHGSKTSTSYDFIRKTNPKVSLISVGKYNSYNHPNIETINKLDKYYQTSIHGNVIIYFNKDISIKKRF